MRATIVFAVHGATTLKGPAARYFPLTGVQKSALRVSKIPADAAGDCWLTIFFFFFFFFTFSASSSSSPSSTCFFSRYSLHSFSFSISSSTSPSSPFPVPPAICLLSIASLELAKPSSKIKQKEEKEIEGQKSKRKRKKNSTRKHWKLQLRKICISPFLIPFLIAPIDYFVIKKNLEMNTFFHFNHFQNQFYFAINRPLNKYITVLSDFNGNCKTLKVIYQVI